jgi:hypothetical protein
MKAVSQSTLRVARPSDFSLVDWMSRFAWQATNLAVARRSALRQPQDKVAVRLATAAHGPQPIQDVPLKLNLAVALNVGLELNT